MKQAALWISSRRPIVTTYLSRSIGPIVARRSAGVARSDVRCWDSQARDPVGLRHDYTASTNVALVRLASKASEAFDCVPTSAVRNCESVRSLCITGSGCVLPEPGAISRRSYYRYTLSAAGCTSGSLSQNYARCNEGLWPCQFLLCSLLSAQWTYFAFLLGFLRICRLNYVCGKKRELFPVSHIWSQRRNDVVCRHVGKQLKKEAKTETHKKATCHFKIKYRS